MLVHNFVTRCCKTNNEISKRRQLGLDAEFCRLATRLEMSGYHTFCGLVAGIYTIKNQMSQTTSRRAFQCLPYNYWRQATRNPHKEITITKRRRNTYREWSRYVDPEKQVIWLISFSESNLCHQKTMNAVLVCYATRKLWMQLSESNLRHHKKREDYAILWPDSEICCDVDSVYLLRGSKVLSYKQTCKTVSPWYRVLLITNHIQNEQKNEQKSHVITLCCLSLSCSWSQTQDSSRREQETTVHTRSEKPPH